MAKLKFIPGRPPGPPKTDYRTIKLKEILKGLPAAPETSDVDEAVAQAVKVIIDDHAMWLNDVLGICVVAGWLAELLRWITYEQGKQPVFTDADAKKEYFQQTGGYNSGLNLLDYLNHLRKDGIVLNGKVHKIHAFASVDIHDHEQIRLGVQYLRGVYLGMMVPQSMMEQFDADQPFDVVANEGGLLGGHCFTGDTKIAMLNGENLTLKQLTEQYENKTFWVYSCDDSGNIVPGRAHTPRLTHQNSKILKVVLDSGEVIKCDEGQLFLMRDGTYKKATELAPNDSLMPLYKSFGPGGHETVFNPRNQKYILTHRIVAGCTLGSKPNDDKVKVVVHHKNFNKFNNSPDNLIYMTWEQHTKLHREQVSLLKNYAQSEQGRNTSRALMTALWTDPEWRKASLLRNSKNGKLNAPLMNTPEANLKKSLNKKVWWDSEQGSAFKVQMHSLSGRTFEEVHGDKSGQIKQRISETLAGNIPWNKGLSKETDPRILKQSCDKKEWWAKRKAVLVNHKVSQVVSAPPEDVYDFEVEQHHNFALSAGVFVHNCVYSPAYLKFRIEEVTQVGPVIRTWGKRCQATWRFFDAYFDEGYVVIIECDPLAANIIDMTALDTLLQQVTNQPPPPPDPTPPPAPPAPPKPGCLGMGSLKWLFRRP
jgi:intein/homing endonuclease